MVTGTDVLVLGAGPAGWAAAAACARAGLTVALLAPNPEQTWTQTYGAWLDELSAAGVPTVASHHWDTTLVRTAGIDYQPLGRTYCLIDNARLRDLLVANATDVTVHQGRAAALDAGDHERVITTTGGARVRARAVIDATGYPGAFSERPAAPVAQQTAYGVTARFAEPPIPPGTMCFMDFDAKPFGDAEPATFLYAMHMGGDRYFVEETSLAAHPPVPLSTLQHRLERRLADRGTPAGEVLATERCAFAMNPPLPSPGPLIAFGAAAAMVHPATGFHIAHMLRRAPVLAEALRAAKLADDDANAAAAAARHAVWPDSDLRRDALYRLGLNVLLSFDAAATREFFAAFFALPPSDWQRYISRTATATEVQATMMRMFRRLPLAHRTRLMAAVARDGRWRHYARAMTPTLRR